jgi:aminopeptidase N
MKALYFPLCLAGFLFFHAQVVQGSEEEGKKGPAPTDNIDVGFYFLDLHISDSSTYITGKVTVQMTLLEEGVQAIALDMGLHLSADSVRVDGKPASFSHNGNVLTVTFPEAYEKGIIFSCDVFYHGLGTAAGDISGIYNKVNQFGDRITWTLSEPLSALNWFPCKQSLSDKADSVYVYLSTDRRLKAGSNGLLTSTVDLSGDRVRYEWKSRYPIDFYLISFALGPYRDYSFYATGPNITDSVLVQNYIYDDDDYFNQNKASIDETAPLINLYSGLFGPYPFAAEKYGHCVAPSGGGMEHQTMTTLVNFSFLLVAHELAHMWFGDYVTCHTWGDIWVNEGFASYSEYLAYQYLTTQTEADNWIIRTQNYIKSDPEGSVFVPVPSQTDEDRIFDYRLTYGKGAAIIHMIRQEVGNDSLFFGILKEFLKQNKLSTATGNDFRDLLTEKTGKSFDRFFEQWYMGEGYPIHDINWSHQNDTLYITSVQTVSASTPSFDVLIEFAVRVNDKDTLFTFRQDSGYKSWKVPLIGNVSGVVVDPHHWLLLQIAGITRSDLSRSRSRFVVSPNPAKDHITIRFSEPVGKYTLLVSDASGRIVLSEKSDLSRHSVAVSQLPKGMYFAVVEENHLIYVAKFIKN